MRVLVLGGAGDVGSRAVEALAASSHVKEVTIADRDRGRAAHVASAAERGRARLRVRCVDANDHAALVSAMRGHDVVASALGPFHRFEARLVAAALEAGVDYASVCDEWDATADVLERFDRRARAEGRAVLLGLGTSPGLTNVGVRWAKERLDVVRKVEIFVYQPLDAGGGDAVVEHMLHIMTGDVRAFRAGREVAVPACSTSREIEFPRFGRVRVWNMGHAEPVTLPRFLEGLDDVSFFMGYGRGARALVLPARLGLFASPVVRAAFVRAVRGIERLAGPGRPADGAVRVDVHGQRDGREAHVLMCGTGGMRDVTGLSLAIGAELLGRRALSGERAGVVAPEACLDPGAFIEAMRAHGVVAYRDLAMREPIAAA